MYTDFDKAFDKVPYERLLAKYRSYGINGNILNYWITDFLAGRKYRVKVNSSYSSWVEVTIYDLIDCCESFSDTYLFANDAKIFHHVLHPGDQQILPKKNERISRVEMAT